MFGISHFNRETFPNSFLRNINLYINFKESCNIADSLDFYKNELKNLSLHQSADTVTSVKVGREVEFINTPADPEEIVYKNFDNSNEIKFSPKKARYTSIVNKYDGFDELAGILRLITDIASKGGITEFSNIRLTKLNVLYFEVSGSDENTDGIFRLSPEESLLRDGLVLPTGAYFDVNPHISQASGNILLSDDDGYQMNIFHATHILNVDKKKNTINGNVSLEFRISKDSPTSPEKAIDVINVMNQEIFNALMWVLSDSGKKMLANAN